MVYLAATYLAPLISLVVTSLKTPDLVNFDIGRYLYAFDIGNYARVLEQYGPIIARSFGYSALATVFALLISYPLAYFIGVSLRRYPLWQALALILVIAPFFMSFLLRTLAWKSIFADEGPVVGFLQSLNILPPNAHLNGTPVHGDLRTDLQLHPVHGAADLHLARAPGPPAARGGKRSVRQPRVDVRAASRCRSRCRGWCPERCWCSSRRPATT